MGRAPDRLADLSHAIPSSCAMILCEPPASCGEHAEGARLSLSRRPLSQRPLELGHDAEAARGLGEYEGVLGRLVGPGLDEKSSEDKPRARVGWGPVTGRSHGLACPSCAKPRLHRDVQTANKGGVRRLQEGADQSTDHGTVMLISPTRYLVTEGSVTTY